MLIFRYLLKETIKSQLAVFLVLMAIFITNRFVRVLADASDAGRVDFDEKYGEGLLNLKKVYLADQKDWIDPCVNCAYYDPNTREVIYKFSNQGTRTVFNLQVETQGPQGFKPLNITQLTGGQTYLYKISVNPNLISEHEITTQISAKIVSYDGNQHSDLNPKNNELITATNRQGDELVYKAYGVSAP